MEKAKTITEFRIKKSDFREQFLDEYHNCLLCGTGLIYTHKTDFIYLNVEEAAHCPHCQIQTKKQSHILQ